MKEIDWGSCLAKCNDPDKGRIQRGCVTTAIFLLAGSLMLNPAIACAEVNVSYTYDALGRIASVVYTDGTKTATVTYSYDAAGNRSSVVVK
jgi:uncharacterized protein RhaS with RHS repeats